MAPRIFSFVPLVFLMVVSPAFGAKSGNVKKASPPKTKKWAKLIDHVLAKGKEWPIKAPAARTLGFNSDSVPAKSLGVDQEKSADNKEHNVFIVYETDAKGKLIAKEVVLANIRVIERSGKEEIEGYRIRSSLDGRLIQGMHAAGIVGDVVQTPLSAESSELKSVFNSERDLYLKKLDWNQLTAE